MLYKLCLNSFIFQIVHFNWVHSLVKHHKTHVEFDISPSATPCIAAGGLALLLLQPSHHDGSNGAIFAKKNVFSSELMTNCHKKEETRCSGETLCSSRPLVSSLEATQNSRGRCWGRRRARGEHLGSEPRLKHLYGALKQSIKQQRCLRYVRFM